MNIKKIILILVQICCFAVIIYSIYKIKINMTQYKISETVYSELENSINEISQEEIKYDNDYSLENKHDNETEKINFEELKQINSDIVGWITNKDRSINYPVVQGKDNDYYLNHLFNKNENSSGCIFIDYRNDSSFSDKNSIIYGHNMNNGSMFASLLNYKEEKYFLENNEFYIMTPENNYIVKIFSCYDSNINSNSWDLEFKTDTDYENWLQDISDKSFWKNDISPNVEDRIVTFSTCNNNSWDNRFVVHGILYEK